PTRPIARRPLAPASAARARIHIHSTPLVMGEPEGAQGEFAAPGERAGPPVGAPDASVQAAEQQKVPAKAKR
ncbi:hypothetical protein PAJ63_09100, partial [Campylobacter coli]|uniref:hypothetical protein n=1 Tax=Campylobacter coli TaxID=195 RepID=UPI0025B00B5E